MLHTDGEPLLARYAERAFSLTVTEVVPGMVFHVVGLGHRNATIFIGNESVILVDAIDPDAREAPVLKARVMLALAPQETSANERHCYLAAAKELVPIEPEGGGQE